MRRLGSIIRFWMVGELEGMGGIGGDVGEGERGWKHSFLCMDKG